MKKIIKWQKWVDPLGSNVDEVEWPGYNVDEDGEPIPIHKVKGMPILSTPFGPLSITEHSLAANQFDFWNMHTNFDITPEIFAEIEKVDGVETLNVLTRYRLRVGLSISGLFDGTIVKQNIEKTVQTYFLNRFQQLLSKFDSSVIQKVSTIYEKISNEHNNWLIYILPNGNVEVVTSDKKINPTLFMTTNAMIGGQLLTSGDI